MGKKGVFQKKGLYNSLFGEECVIVTNMLSVKLHWHIFKKATLALAQEKKKEISICGWICLTS